MKNTSILSLLLAFAMCVPMLASCSKDEKQTDINETTEYTQDMPPPDGSETTENIQDITSQDAALPEDNVTESKYVNADFSVPGGFYGEEKELLLSLPENAPEGTEIRYTTDGNEPNTQSLLYTEGIKVCTDGSSVCVRAACYSADGVLLGRIKTNTYIGCADGRFSTAVVSIVTDSENLYGPNGIITNPTQSGKAWERPCHVEMFKSNGEEMISQDAGLRLFGGSSRTLEQKSFRLVARKTGYYDETKYNGSGSFDYPFFENRKILAGQYAKDTLARYDRLVLRNGGNDSLQHIAQDPNSPTLLRDCSANAFALKYAPAVAAQASCFVTVYLNGQYYGILDMKEDINDDYFANLYGIEDKNAVTVVKSELDTSRKCEQHDDSGSCRFCGVWFYYEVDNGDVNALSELEELYGMINQATDRTYDRVYKTVSEKIDLENFIQYTALNLFLANNDWPHNNVRLWKYSGTPVEGNPYTDGKWRFTVRDTDFAMGRYSSGNPIEVYTLADSDSLNLMLGTFYGKYKYKDDYGDPLYIKGIMNFCLKNAEFKTAFETYCRSLMTEQAQDDLTDIIKAAQRAVEKEIPYHLNRWEYTVSYGMTAEQWNISCMKMRRWIKPRVESFSEYLSECLSNY